MEVLLRQVSLAAELKGERTALLEARKHAAWAMHGLTGAASLRAKAGQITTLDELEQLCRHICSEYK
jgi:tRNA-dihydrouridine synthase